MASSSSLSQDPGRFYRSTVLELQTVREKRLEQKTREQTKWGVSIFTAWLEEREKPKEFEHLSAAALDELLGTFYLEARQITGDPYSKSALRCIRSSVQRYLQGEPWNRSILITKDREFSCSNDILCGIFKIMTAEGRDKSSHHSPVEPGPGTSKEK